MNRKQPKESTASVIARERAERAKSYALKFPERISPEDLKFQALDWQYVNEGLKAASKI